MAIGQEYASKKMEEERMNKLDPMTAWSVHSYALLSNLDTIVTRIEKWVKDELGRQGLRMLTHLGGARELMDRAGGFDGAQKVILQSVHTSFERLESAVEKSLD